MSSRVALALIIASVGVAVIGAVPYLRWHGDRDRRDLLRARAPFAEVSASELQRNREGTLEFVVPSDKQWRRIVARLGAPVVLVMVATNPEVSRPQVYSATDAGLIARAAQNGRP